MGPDLGPNSLIFLFFNAFFQNEKATENRIPNLGKLDRWDYLNMLSPLEGTPPANLTFHNANCKTNIAPQSYPPKYGIQYILELS